MGAGPHAHRCRHCDRVLGDWQRCGCPGAVAARKARRAAKGAK